MSFVVVLRHLRERWLGGRSGRGRRRDRAASVRRGNRAGLAVEGLEERTLLSGLPPALVTQQVVLSINNTDPAGPVASGGLHNTPSIAVDPANPQNQVAVYTTNVGGGQSIIQGSYSTDGGRDWQPITGPSTGSPQVGGSIFGRIKLAPNVLSQEITNPITGSTFLTQATDPTVAFDHTVSVDAVGNLVNHESFYVLYVEHLADNSAGAVMMEKFDFSSGSPVPSALTPHITVTNMVGGDGEWDQEGMLYGWAADSPAHSDPALNPVIMIDTNLPPVVPDPRNPARMVSFVDPATGATQADYQIEPLLNANTGQQILDGTTHSPIYQGKIYVAWNTNTPLFFNEPTAPPNQFPTPNQIRLMASSDGGQTFTTSKLGNADLSQYDAAPRLVVSQGTSSDRASTPPLPVTSVASVGRTVTVTTAIPHGLSDGQEVAISGAADQDYNGTYVITVPRDAQGNPITNQFLYTLTTTPTSSTAGGTITARQIAVPDGQVTLVWDNFGKNTLQTNTVQGGAAATFTDNNPANATNQSTHINDALPGSNGPDIPQMSLFTQNVNINDPSFTTASDLQLSLDILHANVDQLSITLLPEAQLGKARDLAFGPDGNLYVTDVSTNGANPLGSVIEYFGPNAATPGKLAKMFVAPGAGGLKSAEGLVWGSDGKGGNDLYVAGVYGTGATAVPAVFRYHADGTPDPSPDGLARDANSALYTTAVPDPSLTGPGANTVYNGLTFDVAGNLYVAAFGSGGGTFASDILRFQGPAVANPGEPVGTGIFVKGDSTNGLNIPVGVTFGPDGELYVANSGGGNVLRFNSLGISDPATVGAPGAEYVKAATGQLTTPTYLTFGVDGDLYVSDTATTSPQVVRFLGPHNVTGPGSVPAPGTLLDVYVSPRTSNISNLFAAPRGLAFFPDPTGLGNLFILGQSGSGKGVTTTEIDAVYEVTGAPGVSNPAPGNPGAIFTSGATALQLPQSVVFHSTEFNDTFLVTDRNGNDVLRYDGTTGNLLNAFVKPGEGLLEAPTGIGMDTTGPNAGDVFVSSTAGGGKVLAYSGTTDATFLGRFTPIPGSANAPVNPDGIAFDTAGDVYIADRGTASAPSRILRFNPAGTPTPGSPYKAPDATFSNPGDYGVAWSDPRGMAYDPTLNFLYAAVALPGTNHWGILRFDGNNAMAPVLFADSTTSPLNDPQDLFIDATSDPTHPSLYVTSKGNDRVLRYSLATGAYLESIVPLANDATNNGGLTAPIGVAVNPNDRSLDIVSSLGATPAVMRYTGTPAQAVGFNGGLFVQPGGGSLTIPLLFNHTLPDGKTLTGVGLQGGANMGIWTHPIPIPPQNVGLTFDDSASRVINDLGITTGQAPYSERYRPEGASLSFVNGQDVGQLSGTWILEITDNRSNHAANGADPVQDLDSWSLRLTSNLNVNSTDSTITPPPVSGVTPPAYTPLPGTAAEDGSTIFASGLTTTAAFPDTNQVAPARGVGPTPVIVSDNTLGSFSPYQGRLYVAYTGGSGTNTDIFLVTSDDGGQTWLRTPVRVNNDSANDGFSQGSRAQFDPALAVDPVTGTLVASWYDARYDAANIRTATFVTTSIDGGWRLDTTTGHIVPDFGAQSYLNDSLQATDAITGKNVVLEPIPGNPLADTTFNLGDHQGLAVYNGTIYAAWAGNGNDTSRLNIYTSAHTLLDGSVAGGAAFGVGPRVLDSTEGPVQSGAATTDDGRTFFFNNQYAAEGTPNIAGGTQEVSGFTVTFDRPVAHDPRTDTTAGGGDDPFAFGPQDVQLMYKDANGSAAIPVNTPITVRALDGYTTRFGPAMVGGVDPANGNPILATRFLVTFDPQGGLGTYSYAIGPDIADRVRSRRPGVANTQTLQLQTSTTTDTNPPGRIPPNGTGGTGSTANDETTSTLNVTGFPNDLRIADVEVQLNIQHTSDSDLVIHLIAPDKTTILLVNHEGGAGQNFNGTVLSDRGTTSIKNGTAPFTSSLADPTTWFIPENSLAPLLGKPVNGAWKLVIDDTLSGNIGTLQSWSLSFTAGSASLSQNTGNLMDQNANGIAGESNVPGTGGNGPGNGGDVYSVPAPVNNGPRADQNGPIFQQPYASDSLPLIVPGPHIVSTFVPGLDNTYKPGDPIEQHLLHPISGDNLVLNGPVHAIDVTFDRDMDPNSFVTGFGATSSTAATTSLFQLLGPNGAIALFDATTGLPLQGVSVSADPTPNYPRLLNGVVTTAPDPDINHPRTFRITLPDLPGTPVGTGLDLDGTYSLTIVPNNPQAPVRGPASSVGDLMDTNENAGLDLLRGKAVDPVHATFVNFTHRAGGPVQIPAGKGFVPIQLQFPDQFLVQKAAVTFNVTDPSDTNLQGRLVGPDGTTIQLFTHVGRATDSGFNNTTLDDTGTSPIQSFTATGSGPYQPQQALGNFKDHASAGIWTLFLENDAPDGSPSAVLNSWALTLTEAQPGSGLGEPFADAYTAHFRVFTQDPANPLSHTVWTPIGPAAITTAVTPATATAANSVPVTHTYMGAPVVVGPGQTQDVPIDFRPDTFPIQKAQATVNISAPGIDSNLSATLIAPDGTQVLLFNNQGGTGSDFANTLFDDLGLNPIEGVDPGRAPFDTRLEGTFIPQGQLSTLLNKDASGTWKLRVANTSATTSATVSSWSLTLTKPIPSNSGRVTALAVDPSDPSGNTVYIAAASGGIWKTSDFLTTDATGPSWVPLTDFGPTGAIDVSSIAVFGRNNDPRQSILFATTGDGDSGTAGVGILRSEDGGATWTLLDSTNNTDSLSTGAGSLTAINTNFASTTLKSPVTDPAATTITVSSAAGFPTAGSFQIQVGNEQMLVTDGQGTTTWTVVRGINGTQPSKHAPSEPVSTLIFRDHAFVGLTSYKIVADPTAGPATPDGQTNVILYAALGGGANGGLWRSIDGGRHWTRMTDGAGNNPGTETTDVVLTPTTVDPQTHNLQNLYAAYRGVGVFKSSDEGLNLQLMAPPNGATGNTLIRDSDTGGGAIPVFPPTGGATPNGAKGRIVLAVPALANNHIDPTTHQPNLLQNALDPQNLVYEQWLYAAVISATGTLDGLYVTKDNGLNWTLVHLPAFVPTPPPLLHIPTNDESDPDHDPTGGTTNNILPGGNGNYSLSLVVDPNNPNVVYLGGLDNVGIATTPQPAGGLIRVDITKLQDPHNFTAWDNKEPDGGQTILNTIGSMNLKVPQPWNHQTFKVIDQTPDFQGNVSPQVPLNNTPYLNLVTDPKNPFIRNSTLLTTGVSVFTNTGDDASYMPYVTAVNGPNNGPLSANGGEENGDLGIHRIVAMTDPVTGKTRLLFGADMGVFTAVDQGDGELFRSLGDTTDLSGTSGDVLVPSGSRNGNLQITQLFDGAAQPSISAAEVAASIRGSGGMFYGNARDNGFPVSDPHLLDNGNLLWSGPLGTGTGVATDATGSGAAYSFQWPGFGILSQLARTNFFLANPPGNSQGFVSRTGTGGNTLQQINGDDPQWPFLSTEVHLPVQLGTGGPTINTDLEVPNSRFAVNPFFSPQDQPGANGNQDVVISSQAGRIFRTRDQGIDWFVIGDPSVLDGTYAPALAYGAPDPAAPLRNIRDNFIYAGTAGGNLFVTLDGGGHWTKITTDSSGNGLDGSPVLSVSPDPVTGTHDAYVVTAKGVYHVSFSVSYPFNGGPVVSGVTWTNITGNLFNIKAVFAGLGQPTPINGLLMQLPHDPNQPGYAPEESRLQFLTSLAVDWRLVNSSNPASVPPLYVGGQGGVYRSLDNGATWTIFPDVADNGGRIDGGYMPMAEVTDLALSVGAINPNTGLPDQASGPNVLVATTYGRGEFAIRLDNSNANNPVTGPQIIGLTPNPAPFHTSAITVTFNEAVDPSTFSLHNITSFTDPAGHAITPLSVTDVSVVQAGKPSPHNQFQIMFATPAGQAGPGLTVPGTYTVVFGADSSKPGTPTNITDFAGHPMVGPFTQTFVVMSANPNGLHVTSAVADSLLSPPGMSSIALTFSNVGVNPTTFQNTGATQDATLVGPGGIPVAGVTLTDLNPGAVAGTNTSWLVQFPTQTAVGPYTLTLVNTIKDLNGNFIDQNQNDTSQASPPTQEAADVFSATFTVAQPSPGPGPGPGPSPGPTPAPPGVVSTAVFRASRPKRKGKRGNRYQVTVTVFNTGNTLLPEPIALVVTNLKGGARLLSPSGTTRSVAPGNPFVSGTIPNEAMSSLAGAPVTLTFSIRNVKKFKPQFVLVAGIDNP
jgi:subtilisin-like proprotein convertase family protein